MSHILPAGLKIAEACRYIGISRANLYRRIRDGEIIPAKVGGRTLILRSDADDLLHRSRRTAGAPITQPSSNLFG